MVVWCPPCRVLASLESVVKSQCMVRLVLNA